MKALILSSFARDLIGFRGPLIRDIQNCGYKITVISSEATEEDVTWYTDHDIAYQAAPLQRTGMNPFADIGYYRYLKKHIEQLQPDFVLSYTHKPIIFGSIAARKCGVKNTNALIPGLGYGFGGQGGLKNKISRNALEFLHKRSKQHIKNLFFVNPDDHNVFNQANLIGTNTNVTVLPGEGKDLKHYSPEKPAEPDQPIRFVLITRLLEEKGVRDFVEASRITREKHPGVIFDILGPFDTNPRAITKAEMDQWQSEGLVKYHGLVKDVRPFIAQSRAVVLPSTYREGLPNTLLEGMALGRPIVTYRNVGCTQAIEKPEQIKPGLSRGTNGYLVDAKRTDILAQALAELISEPERVGTMGEAGRRFVTHEFDADVINQRILDILLDRNNP